MCSRYLRAGYHPIFGDMAYQKNRGGTFLGKAQQFGSAFPYLRNTARR